MQEEITQKTIALSVQATKLTASVLQKAIKQLLAAGKNKLQQPTKGKQTLRQLMKQNTGVSNIEITNDNIKAFEHTAKKYGIDFSLKKRYFHAAAQIPCVFQGAGCGCAYGGLQGVFR